MREVAHKSLQELEFYGTLADDKGGPQRQNYIANPLHRYEALHRIIDDGSKGEVKNIYR